MKNHFLRILYALVVLPFFSDCEKIQEPVLPHSGFTELLPSIELWPIPNNHPLIGDSISIKVVHCNCDSVRINGYLFDLTQSYVYTGPVLASLKYIVEAYGYGETIKDSILIIPHS